MSAKPMRILQVVSFMSPRGGGAETWLMDVFRRIDLSRFQFDFLIHTPERLPYHDEIESAGGRLLRTCRPIYLWKYGRNFRRLIAENGPYDACHVHVPFCGYVVHLARSAGIPVRIAHSHLNSYSLGVTWPIRQFLSYTNRCVLRDATAGLACSRDAAVGLFGANWQEDSRWQVLYCGIDLSRFRGPIDPERLRKSLGIPGDAFVLGHVGRFQPQKNHRFLLEIAAELFAREPRARLLLIGDGELKPTIAEQVQSRGIADRVIFAGLRNDVPDLMRGAMDAFALPSLFEGLGLVGIEAQAAGLPLTYTDTLPEEIAAEPSLVRPMSLNAPASAWAEAILTNRPPRPDATQLLERLDIAKYSVDRAVKKLESFYERILGQKISTK